jgi:hypothetical protein
MALPNTPQIVTSVAAPNLPIAPNVYSETYFDTLNNVLRLYFNQVSNNINLLALPSTGNTASRPVNKVNIGQQYFDTTLGVPIWWNGSAWVNASGAVV